VNLNQLSIIAISKLQSEIIDDLKGKNINNDITSNTLIDNKKTIKVAISNRESLTLCGEFFLKKFIKKKFPSLIYKSYFKDGDYLHKQSKIAEISGNCKIIFAIERTLLNFIQHLSSISTYTKELVILLQKTNTKLLNTRKTITGLRKLQKYATTIGGAKNHRMGLYDGILVKDNHIQIFGDINKTLKKLSEKKIKNFKIECETISQVKKSIEAGAEYILLDNMKPNEIKKSVKLKNTLKSAVKFEITGGIKLKNLKKFAYLGADFISTGEITNCPKSVDIGMDII
tara:strand:+ start:325 stop:1182 length:858 start_codon:yes stop_codon:yes gene_type:complete